MIHTNNQSYIAICHNHKTIIDMLVEIGINPDLLNNERSVELIYNFAAVLWQDNSKLSNCFYHINKYKEDVETLELKLNAEKTIVNEITNVSKHLI